MKKTLLGILYLAMSLVILSCGPSTEEVKIQHEKEKKALADSLKNVFEQKVELERQKAEEKRIEQEKKILAEKKEKELRQRTLDEYNKRPEVIRKNLLKKELANPLKYLSAKYEIETSLWSSGYTLKGNVFNTATLATFKDVVFRVECFSKTKTLIKTFKMSYYEYLPPNNYKPFEIKFKNPEGAISYRVTIIDALGSRVGNR